MKLRQVNAIILAAVLLISVSNGWAKTLTGIKGTLANADVYPYVYLYKTFGAEVEKLDSVKLVSGAFEFKEKSPMSRGFYKIGVDEKSAFTFVYDNTDLQIDGDLAKNTVTIKDSKENELYGQYLEINAWHGSEFKKLDQQAQGLMELRQTDPQRFSIEISKLQLQLDSLNFVLRNKLKEISNSNKGSFISKVASMFITYDTTSQASFLNKEEFSDVEYSRGDMLSNKIFIFMQRYYQQGDLKLAAYQVLSKAVVLNPNKEVAYITLIKAVYQKDQDYARTLAEQYVRDFPNSKYAQYYISVIPKGMPKVGDLAPDIKGKDVNGKVVSLHSLKGNVVLLDFWASWCGPCRKENPNVVAAYKKFKDKGFTIYSVSLDSKKDAWIAAIQKDGLVWNNHVSDLMGWGSEYAKAYGVRGIPAAFLLDKTGKIVATNLRGIELENAIEKLFSE